MDGRQKPDGQPENRNDLNDEEIIDLTQVVQEGNDDEIIDLTNVLDQPEMEPATLNEAVDRLQNTDEDIIDLTEAISAADAGEDATTVVAKEDEDEIIDLDDMETTLETDLSEGAPEDDEDLIDLLEAVEPEALPAETDDLADLEIRAETTLTDTSDSIEELDISIAQESPPTAEEDQDLTLPEEEGADEIIDLTGMEATLEADTALENEADAEDVIDLLEAVEPEALAAETDDSADLEIRAETTLIDTLDLTEESDISIAEETTPTAEADQDLMLPAQETDDDEIIDLTGMEAALDADIADQTLADEVDDEDVIDLLDAVEPEAPADQAEDLTDLETRAETMVAGTLDSTEESDIGIAEETSPVLLGDQEFTIPEVEAGTSDEELPPTALSEPTTTDTVHLTDEQLEAALERTIHRIYAEKIEQLMIQTIEKTVQREIEKIKQALLEDDDDVSA